jgi:hypothetical protein
MARWENTNTYLGNNTMLEINDPVDTVYKHQQYEIGTRLKNKDGNEYVFLPGTTSVAQYDCVLIKTTGTGLSLGSVTRLVRAYAGPVAVAQAAITGPYYGWFQVKGVGWARAGSGCAGGSPCYASGTTAGIGEAVSASSGLEGCLTIGASAAVASGTVKVFLNYPFAYGQVI